MTEIQKHTTKPEELESLLFVLKAVSDDSTRPFLSVLHIERNKTTTTLVATDGRRLHIASGNLEIEAGDYEPIISKSSIILRPRPNLTFPNWKAVLPKTGSELGAIDLSDSGLNRKKGNSSKMTQELVKLYEQTKRIVNLHYLDDLTKATWTVFGGTGNNKALMFKCMLSDLELNAVIMPLEAQAA